MIEADGVRFTLPDRRPLTDCEWEWVIMLRTIASGHLPPLTLTMAQNMQIAFRKGAI